MQIKTRKCITAIPKAVKSQESSDLYLPFRIKKKFDFISSDFKFEVCGWPCCKAWNKERNGGWLEKWNEIVGSKSKRVLQTVSKTREWRVFQAQVLNPKHCSAVHISNVKPRPNDRNMPTQYIATLLGATCCVRLATMLQHVATCWVLLAQIWPNLNLSQQHPACLNRVAKRAQHVAPNNIAICCVGMLRSFGRGLRLSGSFFAWAKICKIENTFGPGRSIETNSIFIRNVSRFELKKLERFG